MQVLKGSTCKFCSKFYRKKNARILTSYFSVGKNPDRVLFILHILSHILKSLKYQILIGIVSSDKRPSHTGDTFSTCLTVTESN